MIKYPKIDILFFERPLVDLKKFAFKISDVLKVLDDDLKIGAVCIELPRKGDSSKIDYFFYRSKIKNIDFFLEMTSVKMIVFTQSRIPDLEFMLHAKKRGIKTIMIQEGVMFDGMNINDVNIQNAFAILRYIPKVFEYLNIVRQMCKYDGKSYIHVLHRILKEKKNITIILSKSFSYPLIGDYVLTMGDYWKEYYESKYGYKGNQIYVVGDHDLDGFRSSNLNEPAICYIANALLEDGSIRKKDFNDFIEILARTVDKKTKLYVKLHPRSNKSYYDRLNTHNVEFIRNGELPSVNVYIGHRSALLGRALYESDALIIWRFPNEEFCFYEKYATATCSDEYSFKKALNSININEHSNEKLADISSVYWSNPKGAIKTIANCIYNYMMNNKL